MERALRHISVERGHDPRQFALLPFGGAGGLHAVDLARALRIPTIIAPTAPGALSAVGVLVADVIKDQSRTVMFTYRAKADCAARKSICAKWKEKRRALLRAEGFPRSRQRHERSLAMRYRGQSFELEVRNTTGDLAAAFHRAHRERYGYAQEQSEIEIVSARLRSFGLVEKLPQEKLAAWQKQNHHGHVNCVSRSGAKDVLRCTGETNFLPVQNCKHHASLLSTQRQH